jgi:hypothetical protein
VFLKLLAKQVLHSYAEHYPLADTHGIWMFPKLTSLSSFMDCLMSVTTVMVTSLFTYPKLKHSAYNLKKLRYKNHHQCLNHKCNYLHQLANFESILHQDESWTKHLPIPSSKAQTVKQHSLCVYLCFKIFHTEQDFWTGKVNQLTHIHTTLSEDYCC